MPDRGGKAAAAGGQVERPTRAAPTTGKTDPDAGGGRGKAARRIARIGTAITPELAAFLRDGPTDSDPDVSLLRLIHRGDDGYVSFHREQDGRFTNLFSVQAAHAKGMFPKLRKHLLRDAYFSINGFCRGGFGRSPVLAALDAAYRESDGLRWLNACFADLDCYRLRLDPHDVVLTVLRMEREGLLPPAIVIVLSGRGVWVLWLLRDPHDPALPQRAWPERVDLYRDVQDAIARLLAELGSEAKDPARVTRVPGSVHSGAGRRVKYWARGRDATGVPYYTLGELAAFFKATPGRRRGRVRGPGPAGRNPKKRAGFLAMRANRKRQFDTLRKLRGGFRKGHRMHAALVYAHILSLHGRPDAAIRDAVYALGAECLPPLKHSECDKAVRGAHAYTLSDRRISDWLGVTPAESGKLNGWPPASVYGAPGADEPRATRSERTAARRRLLRDLIGNGRPPTVRATAALLREHGHRASVGTVQADYDALGVTSGRTKVNDRGRQGTARAAAARRAG